MLKNVYVFFQAIIFTFASVSSTTWRSGIISVAGKVSTAENPAEADSEKFFASTDENIEDEHTNVGGSSNWF